MIRRSGVTKPKLLFILLAVLIAALSSCRTGRDLPAARLKPMAADKLMDKARENAFDFNDLTIRRINVQYAGGGTRTSFRASLRASRDEKILASVSKLNIPVARVLLTPDDVTFVNYIDKNYFEGNYSFLSNMLNFGINFNMVQAVISNPVKSGMAGLDSDYRKFETSVEDGRYVLQPVQRMNGYAAEQRKYSVRNQNNSSALENETLILRKLMFNPRSFVLEKMIMDDPSDERRLEVDFSDFEKVDNYDYPGSIDVRMISGDELTELNIKLRGFSTEKVDSVELNIPDRYQRIRER